MKITLNQIIKAANNCEEIEGIDPQITAAIGAAYWSGQTNGIFQERSKIHSRIQTLGEHCYWRLIQKIIEHFAPAHEMRAIDGLSGESVELGGWDFDL